MNTRIIKIILSNLLFILIFTTYGADTKFSKKSKKGFFKFTREEISQRDINKHFLVAVYKNDLDQVKHWVECGADVNAINDYELEELEKLNDENHLNIGTYMQNKSALMLTKSVEMMDYLISQGADVNNKARIRLGSPKNSPRTRELSVLLQLTNEALQKGDPKLVISLLKTGVEYDEHFIRHIQEQQQTSTTKAILKYIKQKRAQEMDDALKDSCCKDVTNLIAEYLD